MGRFVEDNAKRVFRLANAVFERGDSGLQFIEVGACLRNGGVGGQACLLHGFHCVDVFLPEHNGFIGGAELFVEHLHRVVEVGNGRNDGRLRGLLRAGCDERVHAGFLAVVAQRAPRTEFPREGKGKRVGLGGLAAVETCDLSLGGNGECGQIGKFGNFQADACLLDVVVSLLQVGVLSECLLNELLQLRVGKDFAPRHIAEAHRVRALHIAEKLLLGSILDALRTLVVFIGFTSCQHKRAGEDEEDFFHNHVFY